MVGILIECYIDSIHIDSPWWRKTPTVYRKTTRKNRKRKTNTYRKRIKTKRIIHTKRVGRGRQWQ